VIRDNNNAKLRELIREALQRTGLSMRQASLAAGKNEAFLKVILNGSIRDPGIGGIMRLANVLDIDKHELLEAVERDHVSASDNLEAAIEVLKSMTPAERVAFVQSRRRQRP
jgi:hypothetical protein